MGSDPSDDQVDALLVSSLGPLAAQFADLVDHFGLRLEVELGEQPDQQQMEGDMEQEPEGGVEVEIREQTEEKEMEQKREGVNEQEEEEMDE